MSGEENEPGDPGEYIPHLQPDIFSTRAQVKRANKKREKLVRRAALARAGAAPQPQPARPAGPAADDEAPTAMVVETSLRYGSFERHTTGAEHGASQLQQGHCFGTILQAWLCALWLVEGTRRGYPPRYTVLMLSRETGKHEDGSAVACKEVMLFT